MKMKNEMLEMKEEQEVADRAAAWEAALIELEAVEGGANHRHTPVVTCHCASVAQCNCAWTKVLGTRYGTDESVAIGRGDGWLEKLTPEGWVIT